MLNSTPLLCVHVQSRPPPDYSDSDPQLSLIHISEPTRQEAISYAVFSMLLAVYRHHALDVEAWLTSTGFMRATLVANVGYAIVGMLLAIHSSCVALEIGARFPCAGDV